MPIEEDEQPNRSASKDELVDDLPKDPYRAAAMAAGWREGGGYIFDGAVFDSWKEAVSWSGDDGRDERERSSNLYATWKQCCEAEDIEIVAP
ncbi:hypothetical protein [Mesorhizobium sp. IMUNJ 23232]|uniref:hypothetical protein n=1 Tax=Mesorhizobium sp. IMUNJ 23232 TaxID=3376064 RepID=UPI0037B6FC0F